MAPSIGRLLLRPIPEKSTMSIENERSQTDWIRFYILLAISVVMATVGLYRNSVAVVIAAMLVAPLMSPILDVASALVMGWMLRVLRLLLAIGVASILTMALSFVIPVLVDAPRGMVIPDQVLARTDPGLEELVIAIASGLAGAYVQMRKQEAALLPGVAIGVSLVPPLSAAGLLLYFGELARAWEATELFLTNLTAIVLCASLVFMVLGLRPEMRKKGYVVRVGTGAIIMLVGVSLITLDLARKTIVRFQEARDEELVLVAVREWIGTHPVEIERVNVKRDTVEISLIFDVPLRFAMKSQAPSAMVSDELEAPVLFRSVQEVLGRPVETIYRGQLRYSGVLRSSMPELD
jgi:uncharacterized hydrophobic protein (TIGR00271 family)